MNILTKQCSLWKLLSMRESATIWTQQIKVVTWPPNSPDTQLQKVEVSCFSAFELFWWHDIRQLVSTLWLTGTGDDMAIMFGQYYIVLFWIENLFSSTNCSNKRSTLSSEKISDHQIKSNHHTVNSCSSHFTHLYVLSYTSTSF